MMMSRVNKTTKCPVSNEKLHLSQLGNNRDRLYSKYGPEANLLLPHGEAEGQFSLRSELKKMDPGVMWGAVPAVPGEAREWHQRARNLQQEGKQAVAAYRSARPFLCVCQPDRQAD
jgi:hypothetical protein